MTNTNSQLVLALSSITDQQPWFPHLRCPRKYLHCYRYSSHARSKQYSQIIVSTGFGVIPVNHILLVQKY